MRKTLLMAAVALFSLLIFFPQNALARKPKIIVTLYESTDFADHELLDSVFLNFEAALPIALDSLKMKDCCVVPYRSTGLNHANMYFKKTSVSKKEIQIMCYYFHLYRYERDSLEVRAWDTLMSAEFFWERYDCLVGAATFQEILLKQIEIK